MLYDGLAIFHRCTRNDHACNMGFGRFTPLLCLLPSQRQPDFLVRTASSWDSGQKLFVSSRFPDIFGYCGDVQFPTLVLRQIIDRVDQGLLLADNATAFQRNQTIAEELNKAYHGYPKHPEFQSTIVHFARDG